MSRQGEPRERSYENIKAFWEAEALEIGATPEVTIRDFYFRIHELHTLLPLIPRGASLLDVGCGTGFGTLALSRRARHAVGVDYSERMLAWALRLENDPGYRARISGALSPLWDLPAPAEGSLEFVQADALSLDLPERPFDVVTAQRLLINLPSGRDQLAVLERLRGHVRADGLLVLSETTLQGYARTDAYRARFGLPPLERYWHNLYLDTERLGEWRTAGWRVEAVLSFDTYMLLSKVAYPAACGQESCAFLSGANAAAMELGCLFRSSAAAAEIGVEALFGRYVERVRHYDRVVGDRIARWSERNLSSLGEWNDLGHQHLIICRPC